MNRSISFAGLLLAGLLAGACGDEPSSTAATSAAATPATITPGTYSAFPTQVPALTDALAAFTATRNPVKFIERAFGLSTVS